MPNTNRERMKIKKSDLFWWIAIPTAFIVQIILLISKTHIC